MDTKKINNLEIRIFKDAFELSLAAANIFLSESEKAIRAKGFFSVSLSGGRTSQKLYELLGSEFKNKINWPKIHIFLGDERAEKDDPNSNFQIAFQLWLKRVETNIHRIKMELGVIDGAMDYERELAKWASGGFDLALNGAGADGHRNGVMPDNAVIDWKNRIWDQSEELRVWGYELPAAVNPYTQRITLTPWFLNKSRVNVLLLAGDDKKDLLEKIAFGGGKYGKKECPAITFNEISTIVLADESAASSILNK